MAKPKVFVTRRIPDVGLSRIREETEAEVWPERLPPPPEVLAEKVAQVDGLLSLLTDGISADLLASAGRGKLAAYVV